MDKTRAILKIEDGCQNFCSYCLIPFARGKIISKPLELVVNEAKTVADNGYKEVVLTGIHLSSYGKGLENTDLADVINAVSDIHNIERIRLGSLEPMIITSEFLGKIKNNKKLCPSFHLSLQSGCDNTLKAMNRKYTTQQYQTAVQLLRDNIPDCAVTTDVIVGFPGETDDDFAQTLKFVEKIGFAKVHIFPYSRRRGTKAASMDGQLPKTIKQQREKELALVEYNSRLNFMTNMIGKTYPVLVERCDNGTCLGFTPNYIQVKFQGDSSLCNSIINVTVTSVDDNMLYATNYML